MPYKLGDRTLQLDVPWEHDDMQYPANWLRLSTADNRAALGIVWVDDSPTWNHKFYRGYDSDGNLIPKTYADLKALWLKRTRETASALLQPSDWRVVKAMELGETMDADWKAWRQTIRTECETMVAAIEATTEAGDMASHADLGRVKALEKYIEGSTYNEWTADPDSAET